MWLEMGAISASSRMFRALQCAAHALGLAVLMPSAGSAQERCDPAAARVVSVQGTVERQPAGAAAWQAVALDQALCLGDTVRVGRASRAALSTRGSAGG